MEPYIEPQQRAGYLRFVGVLAIATWFVPPLWGMVIGFLVVLVVVGIPIFVARWLVEKYVEVNRGSMETTDHRVNDEDDDGASDDGVPWWADYRRDARVRRN